MDDQTLWDVDLAGPGTTTVWDRDLPEPGSVTVWDLIPSLLQRGTEVLWKYGHGEVVQWQ